MSLQLKKICDSVTVEGQMIYSLKIKIVGLPHFLYALSILMWSSGMVAGMSHSVCGPFRNGTHPLATPVPSTHLCHPNQPIYEA